MVDVTRIPGDYVLATGVSYSVKHFVETAFDAIDTKIEWQGEGLSELGVDKKSGRIWYELTLGILDPKL